MTPIPESAEQPADRPLGSVTLAEIRQQPLLWPNTLERVISSHLRYVGSGCHVALTGAGTSAYAGGAIAASWPGARAIPTTDFLLDASLYADVQLLISLARSGDSPESVAVVKQCQRLYPAVQHLALTCNRDGKLAALAGVESIVLDPRTNDRSLVMTSSFSNLALAGLCLRHAEELKESLSSLCDRVIDGLPALEKAAEWIALTPVSRVVFLASAPLFALAREAALKIVEMTAGAVMALPETFLGLRHGPMSFLRRDTLVVGLLSSDEVRRSYEQDLIGELRAKQLGRMIVVGPPSTPANLFDELVPANAPDIPDYLRVPFESPFCQLLGFHLGLKAGLNPDNPSPDGVIQRVVPGFSIHGKGLTM